MYVATGRLRLKPLSVPLNVRPTTLRIRRSLFSILREEIKGKIVLDLFAGSGALGIEALSCGAKICHFVDLNKRCISTIQKNLASLGLMNLSLIHCKDSFKAVKDFARNEVRFDFIFADPPYYKNYAFKILKILGEYDILTPQAFLILQAFLKDKIDYNLRSMSLYVKKHYGQDLILVFRADEDRR